MTGYTWDENGWPDGVSAQWLQEHDFREVLRNREYLAFRSSKVRFEFWIDKGSVCAGLGPVDGSPVIEVPRLLGAQQPPVVFEHRSTPTPTPEFVREEAARIIHAIECECPQLVNGTFPSEIRLAEAERAAQARGLARAQELIRRYGMSETRPNDWSKM